MAISKVTPTVSTQMHCDLAGKFKQDNTDFACGIDAVRNFYEHIKLDLAWVT